VEGADAVGVGLGDATDGEVHRAAGGGVDGVRRRFREFGMYGRIAAGVSSAGCIVSSQREGDTSARRSLCGTEKSRRPNETPLTCRDAGRRSGTAAAPAASIVSCSRCAA
jgi:hypothetical protein